MLATLIKKAIAPDQPMSWSEAILVSSLAISASLPAVAGLYVLKSAIGINLMAGHSPLHDLLYHFAV